jgi:hypothetical protein
MPDDEAGADGGAGPGIPVIDMEIGPTDSGVKDADFDVIDANLRFRNLLEPQAALAAAFYKCLHGVFAFRCRDPLSSQVAEDVWQPIVRLQLPF